MVENYLEKVYASLIGMNAGIRLGAPVEPDSWTYERIQRVFGEITDYVKEFKTFASDDDSSGPYYIGRTLLAIDPQKEMTYEDVAKSWLNYARDGIGLFWWGGYGVSTSHTVYLNLKSGIQPPQSASMQQNGKVLSQQIGGQLFIDVFGLIHPGDPQKAARYARIAAGVSHDGDSLQGAGFIAACIAQAFVTNDVMEIIEAGLSVVDKNTTYYQVINSVMEFHREHPDNWRDCRKYLGENWGYDKYLGACHVIPNIGVSIMSLLYSKGDFNRAIEIGTMSSWDTDSNCGSLGSILGAANGLEGIRANYRSPINDCVVMSGISGSLNMVDLPTYAKEIARIAYLRSGEALPEHLKAPSKDIFYDFDLPGSTHGFRVSDSYYCTLKQAAGEGVDASGALEVTFDRLARERKCKIYYKPYYRRSDFSDERYMPVFSPNAYPGQTVRFMLRADRWTGEGLFIQPYVRNTHTKQDVLIEGRFLKTADWVEVKFEIPDMGGAMADELGFILEGDTPSTKGLDLGRLYLDNFEVSGNAGYTIDIAKQSKEFASITPFSHNHGAWQIFEGKLQAMCLEDCLAVTGNYYAQDVKVSAPVEAGIGDSHMLACRVQGAMIGYFAGLEKQGKIAIMRNHFGMEKLAEADFDWELGREYQIELSAVGNSLTLKIDGAVVLMAEDKVIGHGMVGFAKFSQGRTWFGNLSVTEL